MYLENVNKILTIFLVTIKNTELRRIIDYSFNGGKRLRPMIIYELCALSNVSNISNISNKTRDNLIIGIELLHSASLILDDMPYMDNDNYRRGKLCVHKVFGLKKSKLVANYMFLLSSKYFYGINTINMLELVKNISKQNSNISKGQMFDLNIITKNNINNYNYNYNNIEKINLKTYPLFIISFLAPFIVSMNEPHETDETIILLSKNFAYMFQITDDFEDIEKDKLTNNVNNHIKLLGINKTIDLYNSCRNDFITILKKLEIYSDFFKYLIKKLDKKFIINGGQVL